MIVAPKDHLLALFDLSQAESWIVAYSANEENMKKSLNFGDIHTDTAFNAFGRIYSLASKDDVTESIRYTAKRVNHASAYGMGPNRMAEVINKDSDKPPYVTITIKQAREFEEAWHGYYRIKNWWAEIENQLNMDRTIITTYGRKRVFFGQWGRELFKEAYAHVPQSTVADHFKGASHPELKIRGGVKAVYEDFVVKNPLIRIINESHDSIMVEFLATLRGDILKPIHDLLRRPLVIKGEEFTIPVSCEVGERWGEMEKVSVS